MNGIIGKTVLVSSISSVMSQGKLHKTPTVQEQDLIDAMNKESDDKIGRGISIGYSKQLTEMTKQAGYIPKQSSVRIGSYKFRSKKK